MGHKIKGNKIEDGAGGIKTGRRTMNINWNTVWFIILAAVIVAGVIIAGMLISVHAYAEEIAALSSSTTAEEPGPTPKKFPGLTVIVHNEPI